MDSSSLEAKKTVAVITRTRQRPLFLARAAQSVASQNFKDFVWIIVNDGDAPDPVEEIAQKTRAEGVSVLTLHLPENKGMEAASNAGARAAQSDFIAIHDDDDVWAPDFLARLAPALLARPDWQGVICRVDQVSESFANGAFTEIGRAPFMPWMRAVYMIDMLQQNLFPPIALLFRRSAYDQIGGFDEKLPVLGDWDFHLRLLQLGDIGLIDEKLAFYHTRAQEGPAGSTVANQAALHAEKDAMIRNAWLRRDLKEGKLGLGTLAGIARQHWSMWKLLFKLAERKK